MAVKKMTTKKTAPTTLPGKIIGTMNGFPVRRMKVKDLAPADYNPRDISEAHMKNLGSSVGQFGLVQGVVWNKRTQRMVGGHQRAKLLDDETETDVIEVDLNEEEEKALNLALNAGNNQGEWNNKLGEILDDLEKNAPILVETLALDELRIEVPDFSGDLSSTLDEIPDDAPGGGRSRLGADDEGETPASEPVTHECPECGHKFSDGA